MFPILILKVKYRSNINTMISIIVAVSEDMGIGKNNELLWHISEDLKRFKKLTLGNSVIMGKKTWESLPNRPLKERKNIVLTDISGEQIEGSVTAYSIEDAISKCEKEKEIFIMGGGSVYRQFMPVADRLYISHVHRKTPADVYFPEIDPEVWNVIEKEEFPISENNAIPYTYTIYTRKNIK
jgi:dihydrofolate reductase